MIDPETVWSKIVEKLMYDLDDVTGSNDDYIDKSSTRVRQLFNKNGLDDTHVYAKSYLTTYLSLNRNSLLYQGISI